MQLASRLFETAMARRDEIADLKAKEAELRAAQRNWRISEALDDPVTGPAPAALEPLLHAIGVAEDELSVLEEAATEARRRADDLRLSGEEDRAKRAERRAISDILVEKWSQEFANWDRAMSFQV